MKATGIDTTSTWYVDNNFTEEDFISGNIAKKGEEITNTITVSRNVADIMEKEIQNLDSMATMKLYVDYLPDNLRVETVGGLVPLKVYYKNIFALISH